MNFKKIVTCCFLIISGHCLAQNNSLGFSLAGETAFESSCFGRHLNYTAALSMSIAENLNLKIEPEYFLVKSYNSEWEYNLRGITHSGNNAFLWAQYSLALIFLKRACSHFTYGAGFTANLIRHKSIKFVNPWGPYWINEYNEFVLLDVRKRDIAFIRPGLHFELGWDYPVRKRLYADVRARYRVLFPGKEFGTGVLNTMSSLSVSAGVKLKF